MLPLSADLRELWIPAFAGMTWKRGMDGLAGQRPNRLSRMLSFSVRKNPRTAGASSYCLRVRMPSLAMVIGSSTGRIASIP